MSIFTQKFWAAITVIFVICSTALPANAQQGCTDPYANNYSPQATINNGSCTYNTTAYNPPSRVDPLSSTINETSGLLFANGSLWTFNDSGGDPAIYRVDTANGQILQTVMLGGATNVDWEDIAFDGTYIYVGDFGNQASGDRTDLRIYKFPIALIPGSSAQPNFVVPSSSVEVINFTYSDQPQPPVATSSLNTKFDCEAMIVDDGKIHLFSKNWVDVNTSHYIIDGVAAGTYVANNVETYATGFLATAADKVADRDLVILLGYQKPTTPPTNLGNHYLLLLYGYNGTNYLGANKRTINLPNVLTMGQAEGIAFTSNTYGFISNERVDYSGIVITPKLKAFDIGSFIPPSVLPLDLVNLQASAYPGTNKIAWQFSEPVYRLNIEYSATGRDFSIIKTFSNSLAGSYQHVANAGVSFYRLSWQTTAGQTRFSKVVSAGNANISRFSRLFINGQGLHFTPSFASTIAFSLYTADGRLLYRHNAQQYSPGMNLLPLPSAIHKNQVVYLRMMVNGEQVSQPMLVQ